VVDSTAPRRFNLGDAMILVPTLAVSIILLNSTDWFARMPNTAAIACEEALELCHLRPWRDPRPRSVVLKGFGFRMASEFSYLTSCLLLPLIPCLLVLRLRRPRPPLWQVIRQPGFGVCATLILGTLLVVDLHYLFRLDLGPTALFLTSSLIMLWIVLSLPPWRPETSWVDRAGRTAGVGWIVTSSFVYLLFLIG
jgi:hypothetical protein